MVNTDTSHLEFIINTQRDMKAEAKKIQTFLQIVPNLLFSSLY